MHVFFALCCSICIACFAYASSQCESIFNEIYRIGLWGRNAAGEGISGPGSTVAEAGPYLDFLRSFLDSYAVQSIVDLGCGDWVLGKEIDWGGRHYLGIDVASDMIRKNQMRYAQDKVQFFHLNGAVDALPQADLLICKDVLMHLSFAEIFGVLSQLHKYKYVILVDDVASKGVTHNYDIATGQYRPLDLVRAPFGLKPSKVLRFPSYGRVKQILLFVH